MAAKLAQPAVQKTHSLMVSFEQLALTCGGVERTRFWVERSVGETSAGHLSMLWLYRLWKRCPIEQNFSYERSPSPNTAKCSFSREPGSTSSDWIHLVNCMASSVGSPSP